MSITYPIAFASKSPNTERLTLTHRQSVTESSTTYAVQVVQTASQWQLAWTWPRMTHAYAESVNAWIHRLKGQMGTFRYYPRQAFSSTLSGKSLAQTGYQYNEAISVGGFTANAPSTLRANQYLQVGDQLLSITDASALADGSGRVTINFEPQLRVNMPAGTAVNFINPCGIFRLNASSDLGFTLDPDRLPEFSNMTAREVI